jgi:hypothetical protein
MGELKASLQKHLCQIPQTELVSQSPQDNEQYDVSRELQAIELSASTLVELAATRRAAKGGIAKRGFVSQLGSCE